MVTSSSRTRLKKVNFRQKLTIAKGSSHLLETSTPLVAGEAEFDGQENHDSNLGVDSGEISEHHLQAALSSTQLASDSDQKKASYHIPTPSANGVLSAQEAAELYPPGVYQDPVSYVRFSDTVEDCIRGPSYNLDEDDADWLEEQNSKAKQDGAAALQNYRPPSSKKGKERAKEDPMTVLTRQNPNLHIITEDEFEMVMTIFERVSKELVPYAHLDKSNLPSYEDLQPSFEADSPLTKLALPELPDLPLDQHATTSMLNSSSSTSTEWSVSNPYRNLHILKPIAARIYPWWKQRREERDGKPVEPTLNFDESNDNDPYVCFRRREVKMMRKTRKTDALHIEKLIRLQSELEQASVVLSAFAQRERGSRAALQRNRSRWEALRDGCDPKRIWEIVATVRGLDEEEEERREEQAASKRRRREQEASGKGGRRSRAEDEAAAANGAGNPAGLGSAILERVQAVQAYIERECQTKANYDVGWEEATDVAFQPVPAPAALRSFRPISSDVPDSQYQSQLQQQQGLAAPRAGRPPSFRRRVGRGGRIFLDRKLPTPSPVPSSLNEWIHHDLILDQESMRQQEQQSQRPFSFLTSPSSQLPETAPATGPFAFLPTVRPTLLGSPSQPREFVQSGPFSGPISQSQHSDASSTSSESSTRSGTSSIGGTSVSTLPTEADEVDIMAIDSFDKGEDREQDREQDEDEDEEMGEVNPHEEMERLARLQERWRYDDEAGRWAGLGLCGLGGMEDDEEAVLDDFDQRFLKYRIGLLEEVDLMKLGTDSTHLAQARAAAETPAPQPIGIVTAGGMMNMNQAYGHRNSHGGNANAAIQAQQAAAIAAAQAMARQSGQNNPLTALQQQQQLHSQQLLLQQQQAAQQRATQGQQQQQQQQQTRSSPASRRGAQSQGSQPQPHPLSQSHSFSSSPSTNAQIHQQQQAMQQLRQAAAGAHQQQMPQGFPIGFPNGGAAGSPPLQSHLGGNQARPSSSPSPVPMQENGNRGQQQQQRGAGGMNGMNFNGLTAEQLQAILNNAAANGGSNNPNFQAQLAAMKAAVAANPNLQLKLPPNRAMQMAQQAAAMGIPLNMNGMNAGSSNVNGMNGNGNGQRQSNSPGYAS